MSSIDIKYIKIDHYYKSINDSIIFKFFYSENDLNYYWEFGSNEMFTNWMSIEISLEQVIELMEKVYTDYRNKDYKFVRFDEKVY